MQYRDDPRPTVGPWTDLASGPTGRPLGSGYLLEETIGQGATGQVWRGRRRDDGRPVAVKVLRPELSADPDIVTRFFRERTTLVGLRHPHLVAVRDLVAEGDTLAIVMDLVSGEDLRRIQRRGRVPEPAALTILAQTASALTTVHEAGVVHRDVKPENVLVERLEDPWVRLTDFGIARAADSPVLTRISQLIGTPAYIAPELVAGKVPTTAVDVYGLGVLAYELLSGRRPFLADTTAALLHAHLREEPDRPKGMAEPLWELLSTCLAKEPSARPQVAAVASAFDDLRRTGDLERRSRGALAVGRVALAVTDEAPEKEPSTPGPTPVDGNRIQPTEVRPDDTPTRVADADESPTRVAAADDVPTEAAPRAAPEPAPAPPAPAPAPQRRGRRRLVVACVLAVCVVLGVGAAAWFGLPKLGGTRHEPADDLLALRSTADSPTAGAADVHFLSNASLDGLVEYVIVVEVTTSGGWTERVEVTPDKAPPYEARGYASNQEVCFTVYARLATPPSETRRDDRTCLVPDGASVSD